MQLIDLQDHLYLIAGRREIFLLGEDSPEWARKLTEEEISAFPYDVYWTGDEKKFSVSSKKTTELSKGRLKKKLT